MLTAKFVARKISVPQMPPKNALGIGCLRSQQTSAIHDGLFLATHAVFEKQD